MSSIPPPDNEPVADPAPLPEDVLDSLNTHAYYTPPPPPNQGRLASLADRRSLVIGLAIVSLLLLALAGFGAWWALQARTPDPVVGGLPAHITPPASLSELATQYPEIGQVLNDPKLDSVYKDFLIAYENGGLEAAYSLARQRGLLNANDELRLTLVLDTTDTTELRTQLEAYGVIVSAASGNEIDIVVPRKLMEDLVLADNPAVLFANVSGLEHIVRIRLPMPSIEDQSGVDTESVPVVGADVWHAAGIDGTGVKVGVLDRGFDVYTQLLGTDLPAQVTARSFIAGQAIDDTGVVHGSAVAEIIYDIAPGAELYLAAYDTDVEQREAVDWLRSEGVRIISHSAGSVYGPMDGSSASALYVDQVVNDGIVWVNSAGNTGYTHYQGTFTDEDGDGYHEFSSGDETMNFIPDGRTIFVLNWDDWGRGLEDYDLYIMDEDGNEIASSTNLQDGAEDDAAEGIVYTFSDSSIYYLVFYAARSTRPVTFDFYMRDGQIEYYTPRGSINTPGDSRRAITVGATNWSDDLLEDYSSQGPTRDGRVKPDIAAPAGISSAAYGDTWIGTSASTPHVAAAAALVLQAYPDYSPDQVADYLRSRAVDLGPGGPDNGYGYGRLFLADPPVLAPPNQPTPEGELIPPTAIPTLEVPPTPEPEPDVPTPTPERVVLGQEPPTQNDESGGTLLLLGTLVICVLLPAIVGFGGIGLVLAVVLFNRSRPPAPAYPPMAPPRRPGPPAAGSRPPIARPPAQPANRPPAPPPVARPPLAPAEPRPAAPVQPVDVGGDCSRCGTPYRAGARFCAKCGLTLTPAEAPPARDEPAYCARCGRPLTTASKFCPHCGAPRA